MIIERFYDDRLAQASYLVGCAATKEALVIDPARNVSPYLVAAQQHGVKITHVTETHIHADFISGSRQLHRQTGAQLLLSAEGGPDWQYTYAAADGATLLHDGDRFMIGNVRVEVLHTPGHTPEHLSFIITDTAATDIPMGIFSGDFIFVGDVGRPDLLEKAAKIEGTMVQGARSLFESLHRTKKLPGHLQVWPGHGAGSACGKALGAVPSTTLDYERAVNWAFQLDEKSFVEEVLAGQPEPPTYFAEMKRVNREGPRLVESTEHDTPLPAVDLATALDLGHTVIDIRPWDEFKRSHASGTINIPITERSFTTWAGWLVAYDRPFYLVAPPAADATIAQAVLALESIGLDDFAGYFETSLLDDLHTEQTGQIGEITAQELAATPERYTVIDVRGQSEWHTGHLPDSRNIPLGYIAEHLDSLPNDTPVVLTCLSGARAGVASSVLDARGFSNVLNLVGGLEEWQRRGLDVVQPVAPQLV